MTEPHHAVLVGLVLLVGSALQALAGFGYGLFAIPVLLLLSFQPCEAISIVGVAIIVHGAVCIWRMRHALVWHELPIMIAIGWVMQPVGVWLLSQLTLLPKTTVGQVFGGLLLVSLATRAWLRPKPREHIATFWGWLIMILSGTLSGLSGMSGPPIVLWVMAHRWSSDRMRVTTWTIFSALAITNLAWQYGRFGGPVLAAAKTGLMLSPVVLVGILPGFWISDRISHEALRRIAMGFLVLLGLYAVLQPILLPGLNAR
jgi:uncharacterized membrane protein YfcA